MKQRLTTRRTVLKTATGLLGAGLLAGPTSADYPTSGASRGHPGRVRVSAVHDHDTGAHGFEFSATTVPSGWTTIEFDNRTRHTHFVYLSKVPQAAIDEAAAAGEPLLDYYFDAVSKPFQGYMDALVGKPPRYEIVFPDWFGDVLASGGVGLTSPGTRARTTLELAPGEYIAECYAKDDETVFHGLNGMVEHLSVTDAISPVPEPRATLDVSVSSAGIDAPSEVRPGTHTVAVTFDDQQIYGHLLGHDVHLVRLADGTSVDDVNGWMNWMDAEGLVSDGTEPGTFVGGAETVVTPELLAGTGTATEYVHVTLTPGRYAWVAEVPDPETQGMLVEFTVAPGGA